MAIKKGIVVLSGSTETHKFLDDGSAIIGRVDDTTQRLEFSGSVLVEGLSSDLVSEVIGLDTRRNSLQTSVNTRMTSLSTSAAASWTSVQTRASASLAALKSEVDDEDGVGGDRADAFSTISAAASTSHIANVDELEGTSLIVNNQKLSRISAITAFETRASNIQTSLASTLDGSTLFGVAGDLYLTFGEQPVDQTSILLTAADSTEYEITARISSGEGQGNFNMGNTPAETATALANKINNSSYFDSKFSAAVVGGNMVVITPVTVGATLEDGDMVSSAPLIAIGAPTYTENFKGMVDYVLAVDGDSDGALVTAVAARSGSISTQAAARLLGDQNIQAEIDQYEQTRHAIFATTGTLAQDIETERGARSDRHDVLSGSIDDSRTSLTTEYQTGDSALTDALGDTSTGETSARISAYSSLQDEFDDLASLREQHFNATNGTVTVAIANQVAARGTHITNLSSSLDLSVQARATEQGNVTTSITAEANAEGAAYTGASSSLASRLTSELATHQTADDLLSAAIVAENTARGNRDTTLETNRDAYSTLFNTGKGNVESSLATQITERGNAVSDLQGQIDDIDSSVQQLLQGQTGAPVNGTLVGLLGFFNSVSGASDQAIVDAINDQTSSLNTEIENRETGDQNATTSLGTEISNANTSIQAKNDAFATMRDTTHPNRVQDMKDDTDTHFDTNLTTVMNNMYNARSGSVSSQAAARFQADQALSSSIAGEKTARENAFATLSNLRIGDANSGDTSLQTRIDNMATTLNTGELTLTNALSGAASVHVGGTFQVGRLAPADVPAEYLTTDDANKGKLFYLDAPTGDAFNSAPGVDTAFKAVFPEPQKWYLYEEDTWHPMPFYNDADGDGVRDQVDNFPDDDTQQ